MNLEKIIESGYRIKEKILKKSKKAVYTTLALATLLNVIPINEAHAYNQEICNKVIVGNGILQGAIAGFGGLLNGKSFWKSFLKGSVGGAMIGTGKCMVAKDLDYALPAKIMTSLGSSITYNITNGDNALDSFGFDYGPAFLEWKKNSKGNYDFNTYLLPESLFVISMIK